MVDAGVLAAKLAELSERVSRVRSHAKATADALGADRDAQELVALTQKLPLEGASDGFVP